MRSLDTISHTDYTSRRNTKRLTRIEHGLLDINQNIQHCNQIALVTEAKQNSYQQSNSFTSPVRLPPIMIPRPLMISPPISYAMHDYYGMQSPVTPASIAVSRVFPTYTPVHNYPVSTPSYMTAIPIRSVA